MGVDLITIIVPVYNVEKYIRECIDSLLNQTYKNLEIILVDDGSKDKSGEICENYANADSRVKVIHKENEGLGFARNTGLTVAQGKFVTFIDSDDVADADLVERLLKGITDMIEIIYSNGLWQAWAKLIKSEKNNCTGKRRKIKCLIRLLQDCPYWYLRLMLCYILGFRESIMK